MSDQDFFFDEDEKPAEKAAAKKPATRKPGSAAAKPATTPAAVESAAVVPAAASLGMSVVVLVGVIGILVGAIGGIFVGRGLGTTTVTPTAPVSSASTTGTAAPQLSPEQLDKGELPAGHPSIGAPSSATTTGK